MISKELKAILDLGYEYSFDVDLNYYAFYTLDAGDRIRVLLDPPDGEGGWILNSSYFDQCDGNWCPYGLDEKELTTFLNFMKTLPKEN